MAKNTNTEGKIAYLLVSSPVANVFIGGMMVVDERGLPVEFRYTEPIQPNRLQQILYGSVLNRYIKTEVIFETLVNSLEAKPQLVVVDDDMFLNESPLHEQFQFVRLTETKSGPLKQDSRLEIITATEFLMQLTPESAPIRVQLPGQNTKIPALNTPKSLPDKSPEALGQLEQNPVYLLLKELGQTLDILEPIGRVEKALANLCQEAGLKAS
jgi:hypothetical protein